MILNEGERIILEELERLSGLKLTYTHPDEPTWTPSPDLLQAINMVWQQIGSDYEALGECDNASAIEVSVDADRLHPSAGFVHKPGPNAEFRAAIDRIGYHAVHKTLCRSLRLA